MPALFQSLIEMDKLAFTTLNSEWVHPLLDQVMPVFTDLHRITWLSHYAFPILVALWIAVERKKAVLTLIGIVLAVALADSVSYRLVKQHVQRERPERVMPNVQLKTHSHSGDSFPSIHTSNIFAAAVVLRYMYPALRSFVFIIAFLIGYSRIYVGVHFPLDVVGGAIIGYFCGFFTIAIGNMIKPRNWNYELPWFAKRE
jgi:undecaprenyl-diphosphatase